MISVLNYPLFSAMFSEGRTECVGLMDLLSKAHLITDIKANSCTGKLALIRFCIAFLCDAYQLCNLDDRADLLDAGAFDKNKLLKYVAECEAEGVCFDLDDEKHPFMQAAYDVEMDEKSEKPIAKILFDCPGGNNHIHLDHRHEDAHEVDTPTAFEAMLETYMFCPAGLSGASNVNNTPPVYAIVYGKNMFETLVLNMVSADEIINIPYGEKEIAWRRNHFVVPGERIVDMSFLKAMTWQPRRLTLHWDEDGKVRNLNLQNGLNFQGNGLWMDPHVVYRRNKDGLWFSVKPELGRELWRDVGILISGDQNVRGTVPLQNMRYVTTGLPAVMDVELIGMISNQEAILGRTSERLRLPVQLFSQEDLAQEFRTVLNIAETMNKAIDNVVKQEFCHAQDKKKKSTIAQQASEAFLHEINTILFGRYLDELMKDDSFSDRSSRYFNEIWRVLDQTVLTDIVERTGNDVAALKRQNTVRSKIWREYDKLKKEVGVN